MSQIPRRRDKEKYGKRYRYEYRKDVWLTLGEIAKIPSVKAIGLTSSNISNRIQVERSGVVIRWKNLEHILTTPIDKDKKFLTDKEKPINPERTIFIDNMQIWPIGSLNHKARIMQSKEIK